MVALRTTIIQDTLSPELSRLAAAARDLSPAMAAIAAYMLSETQQRFEDQKGPDGVAWPPSAAAKEEGRQTLVATGRLLDSITTANDATSATVGTNVVYAAIHNQGGKVTGRTRPDRTTAPLRTPFGFRASVTMPRRQFVGFAAEDPAEFKSILAEHLTGRAA